MTGHLRAFAAALGPEPPCKGVSLGRLSVVVAPVDTFLSCRLWLVGCARRASWARAPLAPCRGEGCLSRKHIIIITTHTGWPVAHKQPRLLLLHAQLLAILRRPTYPYAPELVASRRNFLGLEGLETTTTTTAQLVVLDILLVVESGGRSRARNLPRRRI